ncbi:MAG TPA: peptidylprolyl isomerase, partial [Rhizobiaceae bacterium]|nr:peptidylprolyl isomerase [Rhizobiaceae bacterium]
ILSEQEMVAKMLERGGDKPSATEYFLQQVIFVVPAAKRNAILKKREQEAVSMRNRFSDCKSTRDFAKGLRDVTVRDLGRILEPELPPDWAPLVKGLAPGKATKTRVTDRGVEFLAVCSAREVSDDRVAQLMLSQSGESTDKDAEALSKKYVEELREKAKIKRR